MKKSYYCKFCTNLPVERLKELFQKIFDMEFELHESSYIGEYYKYSGLFSDSFTINPKQSASADCLIDEDYEKYSCLIFLRNTNGKNSDKLLKTKYIKDHLKKIDSINLLSENILEEK